MHFDLQELIHLVQYLNWLEEPFTMEEIDVVIANVPTNKSPGPNGFNSDFMKKCLSVIKYNFYELYQAFFNEDTRTQSIHNFYTTIVSKKENPENVNDYRLMSLLNSSIKLITKMLADRLQQVIMMMIHENEYGFIKSRVI
jgi:hypothetical protein